MKKLTALLLSVGVLFSMSACSGSKVDDKALDALETAIQNVTEMKSADYDIQMEVNASGQMVKAGIDGTYNFESSKPQFSLGLDLSASGQKIDDYVTMYMDSNYVYTNMMGLQKEKEAIKDTMNQIPSISLDKDTLKIPKDKMKEYLEEASIKGDTLTLVFDKEKLNKELKDNLNSLASVNANVAGNSVANVKDATIKEVKLVVKLENGQFRKADMNFNMTQKANDKEEEANIKMSMEFKNVGKNQQVKFPADLKTYPEKKKSVLELVPQGGYFRDFVKDIRYFKKEVSEMKKGWKVVLVILMLTFGFSMSGCSSKVSDEAFQVYQDTVKKMEELKSADIKMKMLFDADDMNMHMKVTADMLYNAEKQLQLAANFGAAMSGVKMDDFLQLYVNKNMFYMNMMNQEKIAYDLKPVIAALEKEMPNSLNVGTKDQFKELSMKEQDGKYHLHAVFNDKTMQNALKSAKKTNKQLQNGNFDAKLDKYEADLVVAKDKMLESIVIHMDMNIIADKQSMPMKAEVTMNIAKPNQVTDIKMPSFKDYPKADFNAENFLTDFGNTTSNTI